MSGERSSSAAEPSAEVPRDRFVGVDARTAAPSAGLLSAGRGRGFDANQEVVSLTQALVRIDSGPNHLSAGEQAVCDVLEQYARDAGLGTQRFDTTQGKPVLVVTLPGSDPALGSIGFVHHSDVVGTEGQWHLGQPFSGDITTDEHGREVLVGRGSIDTKGPAAQVLVAMKQLVHEGHRPARTLKLYVFPDEETGSAEGAAWVATHTPETVSDVRYWIVEGSGVIGRDLVGLPTTSDVPYLAVAQKYTLPSQLRLKTPTSADDAARKTLDALSRLDRWADKTAWTYVGDKAQTNAMFNRLGHLVGGVKGWVVRHLWCVPAVRKLLGPAVAAANKTDFSKTDIYLSDNPSGCTENPNVKPSSASAVMRLTLPACERGPALEKMRQCVGGDLRIEPLEPVDNAKPTLDVRLSLPQAAYQGGNHGSTPDREHDAVDLVNRGLASLLGSFSASGLPQVLQVCDFSSSKSDHDAARDPSRPVTSAVTLDLRVQIDDDRDRVLREMQHAVGDDFEIAPLYTPVERTAHVRRLEPSSPLFQVAQTQVEQVYGVHDVLFGNTTSSNDCRFLGDVNPHSETLAFVPVLYTGHGAHGPDECVTTDSLRRGVDWCTGVMRTLGSDRTAS